MQLGLCLEFGAQDWICLRFKRLQHGHIVEQGRRGGFYLSRKVMHVYEGKLKKVSNTTHYVRGCIRTPFFYVLYQMSEKASIVSRPSMSVNLESCRNVLLVSSYWWLKVTQH